MKARVLHITPHLGGGVGEVLYALCSAFYQHEKYEFSLVSLDRISEGQEKRFFDLFTDFSHSVALENKIEQLFAQIEQTDVVVVHWWNHPLLTELLINQKLPKCRLVFWSHVSGLSGLNKFTQAIAEYPDLLVLTTNISRQCLNNLESFSPDRNDVKTIWSTAGLRKAKINEAFAANKQMFRVGYLGTLSYAKLKNDFLQLCEKINIPNVQFDIVGDIPTEFEKQLEAMPSKDKFVLHGYIPNGYDMMKELDVFGYPLSSNHYGTCDQVLAEAMFNGVVPVVFANPMELSIVEHMVDGLVVHSNQEYIAAITELYLNPSLRRKLSIAAREKAQKLYSVEKMKRSWETALAEAVNVNKSEKTWCKQSQCKLSILDVFFETQDIRLEQKTDMEQKMQQLKSLCSGPEYFASSKGTIFHYLSYFSQDPELKQACKALKGTENDDRK